MSPRFSQAPSSPALAGFRWSPSPPLQHLLCPWCGPQTPFWNISSAPVSALWCQRVGDWPSFCSLAKQGREMCPLPPECHNLSYRPWNTALSPLPFLPPFKEAGWWCSHHDFPFYQRPLPSQQIHLCPLLRVSSSLDAQPWERPGSTDLECMCPVTVGFLPWPHQTGCYTDAVFLLMSQTTQTYPDSWWVCSSSYPPAGLLATREPVVRSYWAGITEHEVSKLILQLADSIVPSGILVSLASPLL